jgi:eIF3 subunit 6 N terminal domain
VSTNERLQQEAQAVLDVIENPDVAQALRQDKNQNLQYLKENYNVRISSIFTETKILYEEVFLVNAGANHCAVQLWSIPIYLWQL